MSHTWPGRGAFRGRSCGLMCWSFHFLAYINHECSTCWLKLWHWPYSYEKKKQICWIKHTHSVSLSVSPLLSRVLRLSLPFFAFIHLSCGEKEGWWMNGMAQGHSSLSPSSLCVSLTTQTEREELRERDRERACECGTVMDMCRTLNKRTVKSPIVWMNLGVRVP